MSLDSQWSGERGRQLGAPSLATSEGRRSAQLLETVNRSTLWIVEIGCSEAHRAMDSHDSVTTLLQKLKNGDHPSVAQQLWQRYFERLAWRAKQHLQDRFRRVRDEEDIALSALDSFLRGVSNHRFAKLDDRDDLWQVLVMLAERKAIDEIRREKSAKRGGGKVRGDSVFLNCGDPDDPVNMDHLQGPEPPPELAAAFAETCEDMLAQLEDPELVQVALCRLEGYSNEEIAQKLGRVTRSVERKLQTIRKIWDKSANMKSE